MHGCVDKGRRTSQLLDHATSFSCEDLSGTKIVRPIGYLRETILQRVVAEKGQKSINMSKITEVGLTSLSDLGGGAVQLTIFRINVKNSTENILLACKNFIFCVRTLLSIGSGIGKTQSLLSARHICSILFLNWIGC